MSAEDNVGGDDSVSQVLQYYCGYIFFSFQKIFAAFCQVCLYTENIMSHGWLFLDLSMSTHETQEVPDIIAAGL